MRKVYVRVPKEFQLEAGELLELLKPLYGLTDSGDYWHATLTRHLTEDLLMRPTAGDLGLYTKVIGKGIAGMIGAYVDDTIATCPPQFDRESRATEKKFESRGREYDDVKFAGVAISRSGDNYIMHQRHYADTLCELEKTDDYERFRSLRHRLAWLTHTRPDLCSHASILSQVTQQMFCKDHIKQMNVAIRQARSGGLRGLTQHRLDKSSTRMLVFCDSSFANNSDSSTQLGFVILLTDKTRRVNWLHYAS